MLIVRVKDRGRDLAVHPVGSHEEADEIRRVYELLGYPLDRLVVEQQEAQKRKAA